MQPSDLKQKIQQLLGDPKYRPSRASELIGKLKIPPERRGEVKKILSQLINEGKIVQIKKDRLVLPAEADLVSGRLQMNERGFGFVIPDEPKAGDIYISAENIGVAMHGDLVVCRLNRGRREKPGVAPRRDGRIIRILKRANTTIVGTLQKTNLFYHVIPDEPRIIQDIYVTPPGKGEKEVKANVGDKVVVKLEPWESRHVNPEGHIIEVLGRPNDPHIDIISIIRKHHLPTSFPQEVLDEAAAFSPEVPAADIAGREDLRDQLVFTIDPEDARDFDDAISGDARPGGGWRLGVHIADVSHYVQPGTALDREARLRGNSVYLPDRVLPMLPEKLSNGLCSLNPNVARLTKSVFFEIDAQGNVESFRFAETVIHSRYRLSYPEALRHLQGKGGSEIAEKLQELWRLASLLRRNRFAAGSLDLEFPEIKVICDEQGRAVRIEKREYDISHQFIEEFMLLANEAVAASTQRDELPSLYRVHEDPDPEKLNDYRDFVMTYGYKAGDLSQRRELQSLIKQYQGSPEEYVLKLNLLKSLKRAAYEEHPKGHYGLAKENYTHFTSPIRRYADLVVHRVVASNLREKKRAPYSMAEL
ncbi:MAG: ribonuclease R, partial [Verrucomicrobiae bacterium]|nr:ribonuclease R [Verrucomicrobiae bacterium]